MQEKGLPENTIFKLLRELHKKDFKYDSGGILSSMCTKPHPIAKKAYQMFLETNLGDAGLFPGTKQLEIEAVQMLGSLLNNPKAVGFIVSGGTEANLLALRVARNMYGISKPEVIVPISAHFSFDKAADTLRIKLVKIELDENYCVKIQSVKKAITKNTIGIVGVAGTTEHGAIDPIPELSEIAEANNLYLHVDAAFGGLTIPFLKELGYDIPEFDFKLKGVDSITVDPHKMGMAPIPAGGILFRDDSYLKYLEVETPYLSELKQATILSTRTGAGAAATWAVLKHLGKEGYKESAQRCIELTKYLAEEIKKLSLELVMEPVLNIVTFKVKSAEKVVSCLKKRGWVVSLPTYPKSVRIVVMPHIKKQHIKNFLKELKTCMNR